MKNVISVLCIFLLLSCQNNAGTERSKFKTIMIKSVGEVETLPNMAGFQINLNCLDRSIKASKDCLVEKSNELNNKLISFGINKDDILTTLVTMNRSYTWRNNSSVFEGYRSSTTVYVTVKDIEKLDEMYTELLENQNLALNGLNYTHSGLDSLENEAYIQALEKSDVLVDRLMDRLPETKKEILKVGNIEISSSIPEAVDAELNMQYDMEESANVRKSIAISKGTVKVKATLFVEYIIR